MMIISLLGKSPPFSRQLKVRYLSLSGLRGGVELLSCRRRSIATLVLRFIHSHFIISQSFRMNFGAFGNSQHLKKSLKDFKLKKSESGIIKSEFRVYRMHTVLILMFLSEGRFWLNPTEWYKHCGFYGWRRPGPRRLDEEDDSFSAGIIWNIVKKWNKNNERVYTKKQKPKQNVKNWR